MEKCGNCVITLAAIIFGVMALIHLGRIFCPFEVQIGTFTVPHWGSYIGFIIFGLLSAYLFKARRHYEVTK